MIHAAAAGAWPGGLLPLMLLLAQARRQTDLLHAANYPLLRARRREDWNLPDPKNLSPKESAGVQDEIESRVNVMLASL